MFPASQLLLIFPWKDLYTIKQTDIYVLISIVGIVGLFIYVIYSAGSAVGTRWYIMLTYSKRLIPQPVWKSVEHGQ